ncbi:flagellar hook protein FlgE [Wukongibacter baidiensis]|uniref:flagellar hook protein FlgE n=1 Tax=Wukongibacter baidiensis TaxID=1723361 RepID=UPI003D7F9ECC
MMRSMYSGVSGLRTHQTKMDIIGNNIANVNTVGFKRSSITFKEIFAQTISGAGAPQGGRGGTNPQQIGLGVGVGSISVNHTQGTVQSTGYTTDLMVDGNGYFIVSGDANAQSHYYTRAGNFDFDQEGNFVTPSGYKVLDKNLEPIKLNRSEIKPATATTGIELNGNINIDDATASTVVKVYDSLGDTHNLTIDFGAVNKYAGPPAYSTRQVTITDEAGTVMYGGTGAERYIRFNSSGVCEARNADPTATPPVVFNSGLYSDAAGTAAVGPAGTPETFTLSYPGADDITIAMSPDVFVNDDNEPILNQVSGESDVKGVQLSGRSAGTLDGYYIATTGEIFGTFTNGEDKVLATIGLVDFDNPAGLLKIGGNLFIDSPNSGTPKYGAPMTGSFGDLKPGSLEMSNVDLSLEFTEMITAQRGFQANSRIITTTDEMLQELVNLKR